MAKAPKKSDNDKTLIDKKPFDVDTFLDSENFNTDTKDKELSWIPLSKAWHDAIKLPGFPRGYLSLVRGYSNTGKSTAFYEAIAGCQKIGDMAVVIETEGNWNVQHAKQCGVQFKEVIDKETGEVTEKPDGFILIRNHDLYARYKNYDHKECKMMANPTRGEPVIEDVALLMSDLIKKQESGQINKNLCFLWDSIGTLNCYKSAAANSSNNMWNAGAMNIFSALVNFKIPSSRTEESEYINTFICVQKIWLDNMNGSVIKHKGGEFMFSNARIIVHLGGILTHGTKKLIAKALNQDFQYGTEVKIRCEKNHITGIEKSGIIASTPHGYWNPDEIDEYKKDKRKFIHDALNVGYDAQLAFSSEEGNMNVLVDTQE